MFVSRTSHTGSSRTSASGCAVGGWLLTMAAVGGFAFAAGNNLQNTAELPSATPPVATSAQSPQTSGSALTVYLPATAGALADGRGRAVAAPTPTAPSPADIVCDPYRRADSGVTISPVSAFDRTSRSSHHRGPASISRISVTACRLAATSSASGQESSPVKPVAQLTNAGAALPGR